jgi:hypothetical protein
LSDYAYGYERYFNHAFDGLYHLLHFYIFPYSILALVMKKETKESILDSLSVTVFVIAMLYWLLEQN